MASFIQSYLSNIESGKGLVGSAKPALKSAKKGMGIDKDEAVRAFFGGDDLFSAMIRSKFDTKKKKGKKDETKPSAVPSAGGKSESGEGGGISSAAVTILKIIAKNSMAMPGISRDINVMRQNLQKLVKLKSGDSKSAATGADAYFLKADEREAALEAQKAKMEGKSQTPSADGAKPAESGQGGMLDTIFSMFSGRFIGAIKKIFSKEIFKKLFTKILPIAALIGALFSGIMDGWKRYQETGNLGDAIIAGLGGALKFLTIGLVGEDELKNLWSSVSDFLKPITDTIGGIFTDIKNFFIKLFGGKVEETKTDSGGAGKIDKSAPAMPNPKDFIAGAMKAGGESDEKIADTQGLLGKMQSGMESGDLGSVIKAAQDYGQKYPQPTPEPAAVKPTPAAAPAPAAAAPSQSASPSAITPQDQIKELEGRKADLDKRLATRKNAMEQRKAQNLKALSPEKAKMRNDNEDANFEQYKQDIEGAKAGIDATITSLKSSAVSPSVSSGGSAAPASAVSGGSSGGGSGASPTPSGGATAPSGAEMSAASSDVAESQRMESSADQGSVINAPTTNNSSSTKGKEASKMASAYDDEFLKMLATT